MSVYLLDSDLLYLVIYLQLGPEGYKKHSWQLEVTLRAVVSLGHAAEFYLSEIWIIRRYIVSKKFKPLTFTKEKSEFQNH